MSVPFRRDSSRVCCSVLVHLWQVRRLAIRVPSGALLDAEISESWERCLAAGLDPRQPAPAQVADTAVLREARERHDFVRRLALAEMHSLFHQIAGTNYLIAFAAPDGMLLETLADRTFLATARQSGICPGGSWGEPLRGTNALGTVAATARPVTVQPSIFSASSATSPCARRKRLPRRLRSGELRGAAAEPDRERTVRPFRGRVHRRPSPRRQGTCRGGRSRHAVP
jgi:hypothetical protein